MKSPRKNSLKQVVFKKQSTDAIHVRVYVRKFQGEAHLESCVAGSRETVVTSLEVLECSAQHRPSLQSPARNLIQSCTSNIFSTFQLILDTRSTVEGKRTFLADTNKNI